MSASKRMDESRVAVLVRIRPGLKAKLVNLAKAEHRSFNQQIEFLLERSVSTGDLSSPDEPQTVKTEQNRKR
jgi:hypothetical protein